MGLKPRPFGKLRINPSASYCLKRVEWKERIEFSGTFPQGKKRSFSDQGRLHHKLS
jgi:hypothetical protein